MKNFQEIRDYLTYQIRQNFKEVDIKPGSFLASAIINPIADTLASIYNDLDSFKLSQNLFTATGKDLDNLAKNFIMKRNPPLPASGLVKFFSTSPPLTDIFIPAGTEVESKNKIKYYTVYDTVIYANKLQDPINSPYFFTVDPISPEDTGWRWGVDILVEAEKSGTIGNCFAGDINILKTNISNITNVINFEPIYNGRDIESDYSFRFRILLQNYKNIIGTQEYYKYLILNIPQVIDVKIISGNHPLMLRDKYNNLSLGNAVDIYVTGNFYNTVEEEFELTKTNKVYLTNVPIKNINSIFSRTQGLYSSSLYNLVKDTNIFTFNSNEARDYIEFNQIINDTLKINYTYNALLKLVYSTLEPHLPLGVNVRIFGGLISLVDISLVLKSTLNASILKSQCTTLLNNFISSKIMGESLTRNEIITLIQENFDVYSIEFINFSKRTGNIKYSSVIEDISIENNNLLEIEKLTPGNIIIDVLT